MNPAPFACPRCGHSWKARGAAGPRRCPKCWTVVLADERKIRTDPIPLRQLVIASPPSLQEDWCAWRDGDEERRGWGKTQDEAINSLLEQEEEERE